MTVRRNLEKLDTEVYATSTIYYPKEEIAKFVRIFSMLDIVDDRLREYVSILEDSLKAGRFDNLPSDSNERKDRIISIVNSKIDSLGSSVLRSKMKTWFNSACEKDLDLELQEELLYRYCWAEYMDRISFEDSKTSSFKDKLGIKPVVPDINKKKIRTVWEVSEDGLLEEDTSEKQVFQTGIAPLDEMVKMKRSNFVVIAARTTIGKSLFMINQAVNNARNGIDVIYTSLEESEVELSKRMKINIGDDPNADEIIKRIHLYTPDTSSPTAVLGEIAEFSKANNIPIVFIDYIQLMKYSGMSDWDSLRTLTREFKLFAIKNDILLVTASQLKREAEMMGSSLSTLFGSSTLEADANVILILEPTRKQNVRVNNRTNINIVVAKNRSGAQGRLENILVDYSKGTITAMS